MKSIKKITISIGLNDKAAKVQLIPTEKAMEIVKDHVLAIGGATIIPNCLGVYTHDNGTVVVEQSLQVIFYGASLDAVKAAAVEIGKALNQESIALEISTVKSEFIAC